jgi:epoxyqueuosine reductase
VASAARGRAMKGKELGGKGLRGELHGPAPAGEALLLLLRDEADRLGLDGLAVADPGERPDPAVLDAWLASGMQASMGYLERHRDLRLDPDRLLPGVRSIVCVALGYHPGPEAEPTPVAPGERAARVSRYALGHDYHQVLGVKLRALVRAARAQVPGLRARVAVDTAPVLERHWAIRAGLGWGGKHGCVTVTGLGSWVFLGEILLDVWLPRGVPQPSRCGDCDRCLRACPTGALVGPGRLDARRCIAYWTIEHRGDFTADVPRLSPWLFGCDLCQEACPWNRDVRAAREPALACVWPGMPTRVRDWVGLGPEDFEKNLRPTPMERAGLEGLRRNARRLAQEAEGDADCP